MNLQRQYVQVLLAVSLICMFISLLHFGWNGINEGSVRWLIRWSSKFSACFFSIAFAASGIHRLFSKYLTGQLLKFRPQFGLSFAVFHSFHLFFLIYLQIKFHPVFELARISSLVGGGLAYIFMYLMVITTFPTVRQQISPSNWKILHFAGGYWIWIIFTRTYAKKAFLWDEGYMMFTILILVMIFRVLDLLLKKRKDQSQIIQQ
jgi:sulfoxide reductase heme-binding subunit YedZ